MGREDAITVKLYVCLNVKTFGEPQIEELHPSIRKVKLPRQRNRQWSIVEVGG